MRQMIARVGRRVSVVASATVLLLGVSAVAATTAQASPPGCSGLAAGHTQVAGSYISAYRFWACENGEDIPVSVSIERYMSPGVYQTVASGMGFVTYYCSGSLYNVYRTTGTSDFAILCS